MDFDLASVRDPDAIAKLPTDEQDGWRKLWDDVDAVLKLDALKEGSGQLIPPRSFLLAAEPPRSTANRLGCTPRTHRTHLGPLPAHRPHGKSIGNRNGPVPSPEGCSRMRVGVGMLLGLSARRGCWPRKGPRRPPATASRPISRPIRRTTPKEALASVLKAADAGRFDYLTAQLADPSFIDDRVKTPVRRRLRGAGQGRRRPASIRARSSCFAASSTTANGQTDDAERLGAAQGRGRPRRFLSQNRRPLVHGTPTASEQQESN